MIELTSRRQSMLVGAIAMVLITAAATIGVKASFGAFDGGYHLVGTFDAAGQGLLPGSDVKVRGVDIGEVDSIDLRDGAAEIVLRIDDGERVPVTAAAVIRPKTLFGEKYVDIEPGAEEASGPYLADGDRITDTRGGFELEQVLGDAYPLLVAIDPAELMTVLGEMADAGEGLGETINRSIANGAELSESFARSIDDTSRFLDSFVELSDELADDAEDLLSIADAANEALPVLNEGEDDLVALLQQAGRLSNDVADLLEGNRPFVDAAFNEGSSTLQLLFDERDQVIPLVVGLRQYLEALSSIIRIDVGDSTLMAGVKLTLGGDLCGILPCPGVAAGGAAAPSTSADVAPTTTSTTAPPPPAAPPATEGSAEAGSLSELLSRLLGS